MASGLRTPSPRLRREKGPPRALLHFTKVVMDQAVVVLERLVFSKKTSPGTVQAQFNKSDWLEPSLQAAAEPGRTITLDPKDLARVFTEATRVEVAVWPLTAMKDRAAVDATLVAKIRDWETGLDRSA
jgi:hypothetical protein